MAIGVAVPPELLVQGTVNRLREVVTKAKTDPATGAAIPPRVWALDVTLDQGGTNLSVQWRAEFGTDGQFADEPSIGDVLTIWVKADDYQGRSSLIYDRPVTDNDLEALSKLITVSA